MKFKFLVDRNRAINNRNAMLLWMMFTYLLSSDGFQPNSVDKIGRNMLMNLAAIPSSGDYARALIGRGADINWADAASFTYLHMAAKEVEVDNLEIGRLVIEKGADVNALTDRQETSLHIACQEGNIDCIHMLLHYGADATIPDWEGVLPIVATRRWVNYQKQKYIHELLFDYTFDDLGTVVDLTTLFEAMTSETSLFPRMIDKISDVCYNRKDLKYLCDNLCYVKPRNLQLFLNKFDFIVSELIDNCQTLNSLLQPASFRDPDRVFRNLELFLESDHVTQLMQRSKRTYPAIFNLVENFNQVDEDDMQATIYLMLSHGLSVTSVDVDFIYQFYGRCELFNVMLHMDIVLIELEPRETHSVARLFYQPKSDIEDFLHDPAATRLLDYYNNAKLKEIALASEESQVVAKAKSMPRVPSLVELCRNAARKYIRKSEPLFLAVFKDDLHALQLLVESGKSANVKSELGNTLLNYVIEHKRVAIFDYLLSLDGTDIDCLDSFGRSPLLHTATEFDEYFAWELIKKGADLHLSDKVGCTFLHLAARRTSDSNLRIGEFIIEKGADVNAQNKAGETPLYIACQQNNVDWVHLLLYYGALATVPSFQGILPLAVAPQHLQDVLFDHTFDDVKSDVALRTLMETMSHDSSLFAKIVNVTSDVSYDVYDLNYLCDNLIYLKAKHFRLFIDKFSNIIKEMIDNFSPLTMIIGLDVDLQLHEMKKVLYAFLESNHVCEFVRASDPMYPIIAHLLRMFNKPKIFVEEEETTKIICQMLTYGLDVTSDDLDTVYVYYGHCNLFKILLHMDIEMIGQSCAMAALCYDPNTNVETFLNEASFSSALLCYYNHPRMKELCLSEEIAAKVKNKPLVQAVHDNDLNRLKALVEAGESVNEKSCSQGLVLNCVIKYGRTEMFDYLMTLDDLRLDVVDGDDLSPLLCAIQWFNEHFVLELIKKGADIHEINSGGETVLHMAARFRSDNLRVGKLFIEAGVDVNRQNCWGRTALFNACRAGNVDWIYMLLYYGACATIPSVEGFLPVVVLSSRTPLTEREQVQEILFNHTFEVGDTVKLSNLIVAMCLDRALFSNIVNVTSNVTFDLGDLTLLNYQLQYLKIKHLRVFVEKFGIIVKELINNCKPLVALAKDGADAELLEILYIFLESEHGVDFVQECGSRNFLIHNLVGGSGKPTITEEEMIKIICLILTYGLDIS
ncbi:Ankyrin repeat domain containing protein, partial [Asbolus verrucosus]